MMNIPLQKIICFFTGHDYLYPRKVIHADGLMYEHKECQRCWHEEIKKVDS